MALKALVIEDEESVAILLESILQKNRFTQVDLTFDGKEGLEYGLAYPYDVILLDVGLPKMDGFEVLKQLREKKIQTPILMLTARSDTQDKIKGLNSGADDYLTKPFDRDELVARVSAITRRGEKLNLESDFKVANLTFNPRMLTLSSQTETLHLPLKEAQILEYLVKQQQIPLSPDWLIDHVWRFDDEVTVSTLQQHISRLRKKFKRLGTTVDIKVVRKSGYLLKV
ncbi:MAG: response regulator transcription factor [Defluviitaleaceae bacterium]|nr:response regulator transcription factor [Defluviitaleaceae bacterium]